MMFTLLLLSCLAMATWCASVVYTRHLFSRALRAVSLLLFGRHFLALAFALVLALSLPFSLSRSLYHSPFSPPLLLSLPAFLPPSLSLSLSPSLPRPLPVFPVSCGVSLLGCRYANATLRISDMLQPSSYATTTCHTLQHTPTHCNILQPTLNTLDDR